MLSKAQSIMEKHTVTAKDKRRFMDKVSIQASGCWLWTGSIAPRGYGNFSFKHIIVQAHRAAYLLFKGIPPAHLMLCHTCDIRRCVNPEHLFPGTAVDNAQDMVAKHRNYIPGLKQENHPRAKLTWATVHTIRTSNDTQQILAQKFGCSSSLVGLIKNNQIWKEG